MTLCQQRQKACWLRDTEKALKGYTQFRSYRDPSLIIESTISSSQNLIADFRITGTLVSFFAAHLGTDAAASAT